MNALDLLAQKHGTDKASVHPVKGHDYCRHYEQFFSPLRYLSFKFLEIGCGGGESMRTWLEYFPNAKVFGVDIVHSTNPWNTVGSGIDPRYTFVTGDQTSETFWACFLADYGADWTVVMDDGGHFSNQIITTFNAMWPRVLPGGLYCIEDLGVSYGHGSVFLPDGWPNHMSWLKDKLDEINLRDDIAELHFSKELAIFRKR